MIRVTRRPIRPKPLTPMPVLIVMVASLEAELLRAVPEKLKMFRQRGKDAVSSQAIKKLSPRSDGRQLHICMYSLQELR